MNIRDSDDGDAFRHLQEFKDSQRWPSWRRRTLVRAMAAEIASLIPALAEAVGEAVPVAIFAELDPLFEDFYARADDIVNDLDESIEW